MEEVMRPTSLRVLVVDDSADNADSTFLLLRLMGHDARVAGDGFLALEVAAVYRPDLVLLDLGLPGLDGYEVARRLRGGGSDRPVVISVSGYAAETDRRRALEAGCDRHWVKPIDPALLGRLPDICNACRGRAVSGPQQPTRPGDR